MQSVRFCLHQCVRRSPSLSTASLRTEQKYSTAPGTASASPIENLTIPPPSNADKPASEKIEKLFNDISKLNLLEVCELSDLLKKRLNLSDISAVQVAGPAAASVDEEDVVPIKAKSSFTIKLMKFEEKQKVALIKEIKGIMEGMNLVQAKKFVESAPAVVKADIAKDEADKLKEAIEKVGGVVAVE
ncbi:39S ribosomal protein L12, mitochondrial [Coccinella septempunctata]|uniref:39S ribosomal protein L12, mitochondrial n=1 Tax=Coccinella septempunctata TaxID=41139 RepID=UPI001D0950CA|nr:39S ribosomal protein L12, mitochondrial [Coccinella septempunctata]